MFYSFVIVGRAIRVVVLFLLLLLLVAVVPASFFVFLSSSNNHHLTNLVAMRTSRCCVSEPCSSSAGLISNRVASSLARSQDSSSKSAKHTTHTMNEVVWHACVFRACV